MKPFVSYNELFKKYEIVLTGLLVFVSRLPFLSAGYGSEEDAFGMVLTARNIASSGIYEYSRLPGHPVPELIYSTISQATAFGYNLLTAIISTIGIIFFMLALKHVHVKNYILAGMALAFTPVVYIASTNTMDYTWALAFILISFYLLISKKPAMAGLALGCAVGCRITSGSILLPFLILCMDGDTKKISGRSALQFIISTLMVSLLLFIPVIHRYGLTFFDFYKTVYPTFAKAFYKFGFAVFGSFGMLAIIFLILFLINGKNKIGWNSEPLKGKLNLLSFLMIILYFIQYWYLPQKAAFMIPAIPFVILFLVLRIDKKKTFILTCSLFVSCFFFGINLSDPYRGGKSSMMSMTFHVAKQEVLFDPLTGNVTDDYLKRKQRQAYAQKIISIADTLDEKTAIIAGWWLGDILTEQKKINTDPVVLYYYIDEPALQKLKQNGYTVYFLPEQGFYNDEKYAGTFTEHYAISWPY